MMLSKAQNKEGTTLAGIITKHCVYSREIISRDQGKTAVTEHKLVGLVKHDGDRKL